VWISGTSSVTIKGVNISCAGTNGGNDGGILIQNSSTVTIDGCTFFAVQNFQNNGGAISIDSGGTQNVTISNSTFNACSALKGGAIFQGSGNLTVSNSCL